MNKSGEKVIDKKFKDILEIGKDYIIASVKDDEYSVFDMEGKTKFNAKYDMIESTNGNYYIVKKDDKYGIIENDGDIKLEVESQKVKYISSGDFTIVDNKIYDANYEEKASGDILEVNTSKGYIRMKINDEYKYYNFKFEEKSASQILTTNNLFLSRKDRKIWICR